MLRGCCVTRLRLRWTKALQGLHQTYWNLSHVALNLPPKVSFLAYHQYCSFIASLGLSDFSRTHQARKRGCAWWPYPLYLCPCTVRVLVLTPYKINWSADALLRLTRPLYGSGEWSGREDLNLRPPAPEAGALNQTALRPDFKESGG